MFTIQLRQIRVKNAMASMRCVVVTVDIDGWCSCVMVGEGEETDEICVVSGKSWVANGQNFALPA